MAERVQVREIDDGEGRLLRIVRLGTGSVVTWRRAQMVLLSTQKMNVAKIAGVAFTSEDRVRDVTVGLIVCYSSGSLDDVTVDRRRV